MEQENLSLQEQSVRDNQNWVEEVEQLKQSQKQLAVEELEKIRQLIVSNDEYDEDYGCNIIRTFDLLEDISDRIKKLGGEKNE